MITTEDKRRIVARNFFTDNPDDYEDYHEALTEFIGGTNVSNQFIDFAVEPYLKPEPGCTLVMRNDGHVASVRESDGFFSPRTQMTQDEGAAFEEQYLQAMQDYPDLEGFALLEKIGWKVIP